MIFEAAAPLFQIFRTVWKCSCALAAGPLLRSKTVIFELVGGPHCVRFGSLIFFPFFRFLLRS